MTVSEAKNKKNLIDRRIFYLEDDRIKEAILKKVTVYFHVEFFIGDERHWDILYQEIFLTLSDLMDHMKRHINNDLNEPKHSIYLEE